MQVHPRLFPPMDRYIQLFIRELASMHSLRQAAQSQRNAQNSKPVYLIPRKPWKGSPYGKIDLIVHNQSIQNCVGELRIHNRIIVTILQVLWEVKYNCFEVNRNCFSTERYTLITIGTFKRATRKAYQVQPSVLLAANRIYEHNSVLAYYSKQYIFICLFDLMGMD